MNEEGEELTDCTEDWLSVDEALLHGDEDWMNHPTPWNQSAPNLDLNSTRLI